MRKPLEIPIPTEDELEALENLYRTTRDVRLRTRAHMVLLAGEQRLTAPAIAKMVREDDQTVRHGLKRYLARSDRRPERSTDARRPTQSHEGVCRAVARCGAAAASEPGAAVLDVDPPTTGG